MPDYRRRKIEAEEMRMAAIAKKAPVLGKWLWVLFWLVIPGTIGSLMTNDSFASILPGVFLLGQIINAICSLTYGAILLKLRTEEDRYGTAGICALISGIVGAFAAFVNGGSGGATWILIFTIPAAIVSLVGEYNEFMAHAAVLSGADNELSGKWEVLWKWYIGLLLGMFGCILLMMVLLIPGALALIAAVIGMIVVIILKLVYLYRTARIFRDFPAEG